MYSFCINLYGVPYFRLYDFIKEEYVIDHFRLAMEWIKEDNKNHPSQAVTDYSIEVRKVM